MQKLTLKLSALFGALLVIFTMAAPAFAAVGDQGVDWSKYNGSGNFGYSTDKFSIAQIGGTYNGYFVDQATYPTQVQNTLNQGKRAHTYIWYQVGGSTAVAQAALDRYLPRIQTPKGSIVALDYESGASADKQANTNAILYGMRRVKAAGYTPMYYSYKPYTLSNVYYKQITAEFPNSLWIAEYPNYAVTPTPNWNFFPSMDDVALFQFTSTYVAGGLDGNIDLTGITDNGYSKNNVPDPTPTPDPEPTPTPTPNHKFNNGDAVKVKASANHYATGEAIPSWVKGNTYHVTQINGNRILIDGINSWLNVSDLEKVSTPAPTPTPNDGERTHVVRAGETLSGIAATFGVSYQTLAAYNGITNPNYISIGQVIKYKAGTNNQASNVYVVRYGDNLSTIAFNLGTSVSHLVNTNGIANPSLIYPGQTLKY